MKLDVCLVQSVLSQFLLQIRERLRFVRNAAIFWVVSVNRDVIIPCGV